MSPHRLLTPPRGASPGAGGAPEFLGGPNPQAADRRQGGALSREANAVMRSPPPAPGGTGLAGRLALSARSSDGTTSPSLASSSWIPASLRRDHILICG